MRMIQTFNLVCDALKKADYIYVCDITPLRETNIEQYNFSVNNIINALGKAEYWNKKNNLYFNNNDLVVIFGIEGFKTIKNKIKNIEQKQE